MDMQTLLVIIILGAAGVMTIIYFIKQAQSLILKKPECGCCALKKTCKPEKR